MDPSKRAAEYGMYVQRQHKERSKLLNFAKVTMANLSLARPDLLRTGAYRLEIISAML